MNPSDIARQLAALRKNPGRKPKFRPCPACGSLFSARIMRAHAVLCRQKRTGTALKPCRKTESMSGGN
jgi:hypothetical protein